MKRKYTRPKPRWRLCYFTGPNDAVNVECMTLDDAVETLLVLLVPGRSISMYRLNEDDDGIFHSEWSL